MTHSDDTDPFLVRSDRRVRSGKPVDAPPPSGPRIEGLAPPPGSGSKQPTPEATAYQGTAPPGYGPEAFTRTWKVTFKRWGLAWVGFLGVAVVFASILGSLYPSPDYRVGDQAMMYYSGSFFGLGMVYLLLFGWWLDHVLARAGQNTSLIVQGLVCGGIGLMMLTGPEVSGDPAIGFPLGYFALVGVLGVALAHLLNRKVAGSFELVADEPYPSPST